MDEGRVFYSKARFLLLILRYHDDSGEHGIYTAALSASTANVICEVSCAPQRSLTEQSLHLLCFALLGKNPC